MTTNHANRPAVRASDAERERVAAIIQAATGAGRLTADEAAERLSAVYAAKFRTDLIPLTEDLPPEETTPTSRPTVSALWRGPLGVHAAVVATLSILLIVRWVASGVPFFWPAWPMLWLALSVVIHARIRRARAARTPVRPAGA